MTFFRDFGLTLLWVRFKKDEDLQWPYELHKKSQKKRQKNVKNSKKRKLELYCFSIMNLCVGNYYYCVITCNN